jgi:hypothetical protein
MLLRAKAGRLTTLVTAVAAGILVQAARALF